MKLLRIIALLCAATGILCATTVTGTLENGLGQPFNGRLVISWQTFVAPGGQVVVGGQQQVRVVDGILDVDLAPNIGSDPAGTSYRVVYTGSGYNASEVWEVPDTSSVDVASVRVSVTPTPVLTLDLNQIDTSTAVDNYHLVYTTADGVKWALDAGGGGSMIVTESDGSPSVDPATTLEFLASEFVVTDQGSGVARAALGVVPEAKIDATIARDSELHSQSHVLDGADHTVSGLTAGQVLQSLSATTFGFDDLAEGQVTQHEAALTVTESQISDLQAYLLTEANNLETAATGILSGEIFVGNGPGAGVYVAVSGDGTLSSAGVLDVTNVTGATGADADNLGNNNIEELANVDVTGLGDGDCFLYDGVTDNRWEVGPCPGAGGGITSLNTLTASTQTFADVDDTNVTLGINSTSSTHTFTLGWTGALSDSRVANDITLDNLTQVTTRNYSDLQSIPSTFAPSAHVLDSATHTVSGQTAGQVLQALTATTFGFANLAAGQVTAHEAALTILTSQLSGTVDISAQTNLSTDGQGVELTGDQLSIELNGATLAKAAGGLSVSSVAGVTGANEDDLSDNTLPDLSDVVSAANTNRFALVANGTTGYVGRLLVEADISDLQAYLTAEVNNLEANDPPTIEATEVYIGTASGAGAFAALSGDVSMSSGGVVTVADNSHAHDGTTISALDAADTTTGAFADARISESSVTQHEAALSLTESQISDLDHLTLAEVEANANNFTAQQDIDGVAVPLRFGGLTADAFFTAFSVVDPTAARTVTVPNANSAFVQPITCGGTDKISEIGADGLPVCSADDGGGGGLSNAYVSMTDGTTSANASGGDTFKFRSANGLATVAVQSNDATHGDNLLVTINEGSFTLSNIGGAVTDGQVPDDITVDLATVATTANAGDSATAFFSAGQIEAARGGTGIDSGALTGVLRVAAGTWTADAGFSHLAGTAADAQIPNDITIDLAAQATEALGVAPDSVALGGDTTGNYVADVNGSLSVAVTGADEETATKVVAFDYSQTLAGNPALNAEEAVFSTDGAGGAAVLIEGSVADAFEGLYLFPDVTGADATRVLAYNEQSLSGDLGGTIASPTVVDNSHAHDGTTISALDAGDTTTGSFADGRISQSSVTQHVAAIDHDALLNFAADEHVAHSGVTITAGAGLGGGGDIASSFSLSVASQEANFLTDGGATSLTCGAGNPGKMQVMDDGTIEYCDGAATPNLRVFDPTASGADDLGSGDPGANGIMVRTALNTTVARTLTGDAEIVVTNGDGVAGAPTLNIAASIARDSELPTLASGTGVAVTGGPAYTAAFDFSDAGADPALGSEECRFSNEGASAGGWVCEGSTADTIETRFRVTDPTSTDKVITFPDATGEVSLLGQSISDAEVEDDITLTNLTQVTTRLYSDLQSIPSTFAPSAHALVGADHTASGLTTGHVVRATGATTFAWQQLAFADLSGTATVVLDSESPAAGDIDGTFAAGLTINANSVELTTDTTGNYVQQVADGTGIDGSVNSEGGTYTPTLDLTEVNNVTFGDNTLATITHTIDPTGTTSPVWSYSDGVANLSAGALQVGGTPVLTASPFGATIDDTELTAEDFGDFTNAGGEDGFTLDTDVVSANELDAAGVEAELEAVLDLQDLQGAVTDAQVPDTITASNYLLLAGGTLTGQLVADNLGIEFEDSDTNPACAAGNYNIFADLSETTLKKCINGTVSDLDTGGGSGDAVTVNGVAVDTTADLDDTATVSWALVDGGAGGPDQARASVVADSIGPAQIDETGTYDFSAGAMTLPSGTQVGTGTTPFNLTGFTDDVAPSAPGAANQFTWYHDRPTGMPAFILNGGSATLLETDTHASEHLENAADEILVENLGTACTENQIPKANATGGIVCATDETGGGAGADENYQESFTSQTSVTATGAEHGFGHEKLVVAVYDNASPKKLIQPASVTINTSTFDVVVTFAVAQSGTLVIAGSATAGGGSLTVEEADAAPSISSVSTIQFDQADGFTVTDETGGQIQVDLTLADAHIPNDITIDLATLATTANAGDSATSFFPTGTLEDARLSANVSLLGQEVGSAELVAEDFGDFTCDGLAAGCTLDTDFISEAELASEGDLETQIGTNMASEAEVPSLQAPETISWAISDPATADSGNLQWLAAKGVTITQVDCSTDVGTVTIQLDERTKTTPNTSGTDVLTAPLVCDSDNETTTSFTNAVIADAALLSLDIDAVASSPTQVRIHVEYTIN